MPNLRKLMMSIAGAVLIARAVVTSQAAFAQDKITPISVCEALVHLKDIDGKPVAIVGRLDCSESLIDNTCYLSEDRCERPVRTKKYVWLNQILLVNYWEQGMPKPPAGNPELSDAAIVQEIFRIRKTTKLGFHQQPQFKLEGTKATFSRMADVKDQWAMAYGRILAARTLKKTHCNDDEAACAGFQGAPAVLIMKPESLLTYEDEDDKLKLSTH